MNLRFTLAFAAFTLLSLLASAQSAPKKFHVGLKFGANFSQLSHLAYQTPRLDANGLPVMSGGSIVYDFFRQNDARSTGLVGGVFARFGNRFYVQPEILFSAKGGRFDVVRQGLETQSVDVKIGTIDVPLLLGVKLGPLRLNAGPMASLTVQNGNLKSALTQYGTQPLSATARQIHYGYQAGVGLTFGGLQLDLRREGPLGQVSQSSRTDPMAGNTGRATLWQLTVGVGF